MDLKVTSLFQQILLKLLICLRKANSMNDATSPSDAIDEAIKTFDNLKLNNN